MFSNENVEEVKEEATTSSTNDTEVSEVQTEEEVKAPEPGSIEYTKAVEDRIGKISKGRYQAEAERDLYKRRLDELESQKTTKEVQPTQTSSEPEPQEGSFENYNDYIKALSSWQFRQEKANYEATTAQQREVEKIQKLESNFREKVRKSEIEKDHPDFYDKINIVKLAPDLSDIVLDSDKAPELALHLASNPDVIRELNSHSTLVAARKLGIIEAKLSAKVQKTTTSSAPDPLDTVNTDTSVVAEDNPKDINAWMKKRRERELAKIKQNVEGGKT